MNQRNQIRIHITTLLPPHSRSHSLCCLFFFLKVYHTSLSLSEYVTNLYNMSLIFFLTSEAQFYNFFYRSSLSGHYYYLLYSEQNLDDLIGFKKKRVKIRFCFDSAQNVFEGMVWCGVGVWSN